MLDELQGAMDLLAGLECPQEVKNMLVVALTHYVKTTEKDGFEQLRKSKLAPDLRPILMKAVGDFVGTRDASDRSIVYVVIPVQEGRLVLHLTAETDLLLSHLPEFTYERLAKRCDAHGVAVIDLMAHCPSVRTRPTALSAITSVQFALHPAMVRAGRALARRGLRMLPSPHAAVLSPALLGNCLDDEHLGWILSEIVRDEAATTPEDMMAALCDLLPVIRAADFRIERFAELSSSSTYVPFDGLQQTFADRVPLLDAVNKRVLSFLTTIDRTLSEDEVTVLRHISFPVHCWYEMIVSLRKSLPFPEFAYNEILSALVETMQRKDIPYSGGATNLVNMKNVKKVARGVTRADAEASPGCGAMFTIAAWDDAAAVLVKSKQMMMMMMK